MINGIYIQQKVQKLKPSTKYERIDESGENRIFEAFAIGKYKDNITQKYRRCCLFLPPSFLSILYDAHDEWAREAETEE